MKLSVRMPETAGIRRSVEVQQGTRGVGKMLRRGLHGSKNWVLEREDDGSHRSPWAKLFRTAVVLLPVWIVMSALTGGPERGGQSVGVGRSVVAALLVLLVGLAVFSARERRQGNEEPWLKLSEEDTESDDGEAETAVESSTEKPTEVLENAQVGEVGSEENGETGEDDSVNSAETARIEQPVLQQEPQQATSQEAETVVIPGPEAPVGALPEVVQQAISYGANRPEPDSSFETIASVATTFHDEGFPEATSEPAFSLVKDGVALVQPSTSQATSEWDNLDTSGVTESDASLLGDEPTTPLRTPVRAELSEGSPATEFPQVSLTKEAMQQPLQGTLQVQFATAGPYPAEVEPVHEGWWIVPPDIEPKKSVETPEPKPVAAPSGLMEDEGHVEEQQAAPLPQIGRYPQVVLAHLASQAPKSGFTAEEKDQIRSEVITWLREETTSGHLSRAEASRMLGVDASTVTRWLNEEQSDDPWAQV